jgi:hypothetical protein
MAFMVDRCRSRIRVGREGSGSSLLRLLVQVAEHEHGPVLAVPGQQWALKSWVRHAHELWLTLTRETPAPYRGTPAALLALTSLMQGNGAMANVALDVAEEAAPGHMLADLVREATDMSPDQLRMVLAVVTDAVVRAARTGADERVDLHTIEYSRTRAVLRYERARIVERAYVACIYGGAAVQPWRAPGREWTGGAHCCVGVGFGDTDAAFNAARSAAVASLTLTPT